MSVLLTFFPITLLDSLHYKMLRDVPAFVSYEKCMTDVKFGISPHILDWKKCSFATAGLLAA